MAGMQHPPLTHERERVALGINLISPSPNQGDWQTYQLPLFRRTGSSLAKVQIPKGFSTEPRHVSDLIACGASTVILRTQDKQPFPDEVEFSFLKRGFADLVRQRPQVQFWLEIGNEPDMAYEGGPPPMDSGLYRQGLLDTVRTLRSKFSNLPNLHWMASLPVNAEPVADVLAGGDVERAYDALAYHIYGHYRLDDAPMWAVYQSLLQSTHKPLWITEMGINHPPMPRAEKARQYLEFQRTAPDRVKGIAIWTISKDPSWANYALDDAGALTLAQRYSNRRFFAETGYYVDGAFWDYWRGAGLDLGDDGISERESLALFGYPLSRAFVDPTTGLATQVFERAVFEWHPKNAGTPYAVQLRRMGAEWWERIAT